MTQRGWYPIAYMFIVTAAFSSVVIGFAALTRERVQANERLAFERAVLIALPELYDPRLSTVEIHNRFVQEVTGPDVDTGGAYTLRENDRIIAYALPFEGQGFWAPIRGVLGIAPDRRTILNLAIYEQAETPGLGAEIVRPAFRNQFVGRVMRWTDRPIRMRRPGVELAENEVFAITGATQTSIRLEAIINQAVSNWQTLIGEEGGGP